MTREDVIQALAQPAPDSPKRIHLIGVAGSGMSGLASLFLALGHRVSGSDRVATGETARLESIGLHFSSPHSAEAVADAEDLRTDVAEDVAPSAEPDLPDDWNVPGTSEDADDDHGPESSA